jgi:serine/threonine protein kinase
VTPLAANLIPALSGQDLGPYRLNGFLGGGGFGIVFHATNSTTGAAVAVKLLVPTPDPHAAVEFDVEGVLLRKLNKCDAVVNLIDSGTADIPMTTSTGLVVPFPFRYLVLSLASGALNELTRDPARLGALAWEDRLDLWRGAVKGIHQMHLKTVAHRDIKADNCLLMISGNRTEVRVTDLGRSKDFSLSPTLLPQEYLQGRGDLRFAPPEFLWFQGGYGAAKFVAADIYGLGSLLTELATGHPMTALALGSWQTVAAEGQRDFLAGTRRDLAILRPQFRRAVNEVADQMPRAIRHDAAVLLGQLCDPVPSARLPPRRLNKKFVPDPGLNWLIRRADILIKRLAVEQKKSSRTTKFERSIS